LNKVRDIRWAESYPIR